MNPKHTADGDRRRFLKAGCGVIAVGLGLPLWNLLGGCSGEKADTSSSAAGPLTIPLGMVPDGQRTVVEYRGRPVELLRRGDRVTARSLLCTHQGCRVKWHEDRQLYICPCHEGKFDADGEVVYGMPRQPLLQFAASVGDGQVTVGD